MSTRFAVPPRAWMRAAALKTGSFPAPQRGARGASPPQGGRGGQSPTNSGLTGTTDPATATDHRPAPADATGRVGAIAPLTPQPPLSGGLKRSPPLSGGLKRSPPYQGGYVEFLDRGATRESPPDKGDLGGLLNPPPPMLCRPAPMSLRAHGCAQRR